MLEHIGEYHTVKVAVVADFELFHVSDNEPVQDAASDPTRRLVDLNADNLQTGRRTRCPKGVGEPAFSASHFKDPRGLSRNQWNEFGPITGEVTEWLCLC